MGYSVCYLIDVPGREFNAVQDATYQASESELASFSQAGSLWDGKLADSPIEYTVELSGTTSIVSLVVKASAYQWNPEAREKVEHWESVLHSLLPGTRIMRVDELILEEWESISEELWFREDGAFDRAWEWFHDESQPDPRTLEIPPVEQLSLFLPRLILKSIPMPKSDLNYYNTLITIAPDSSAQQGTIPTSRGDSKTVAQLQYELLAKRPYEKTQEDVLFEVYAQRKLPGMRKNSSEWKKARTEFFSKSQACLRTSPLAKQFGWGLHFDEEGRIALVGCETPQYVQLNQKKPGGLKVVAAMRSKRGQHRRKEHS